MELEEFADEVRTSVRDLGIKVDTTTAAVSHLAGVVEERGEAHEREVRALHHRINRTDEDVALVESDLTNARVETAREIAKASRRPATAAGAGSAGAVFVVLEGMKRLLSYFTGNP